MTLYLDRLEQLYKEAAPEKLEYEPGNWDCNWECGRKGTDPPCCKEIGECEHIKQVASATIDALFTVDCATYIGLSDAMAQLVTESLNALPAVFQEIRGLRGKLKQARDALQDVANFMSDSEGLAGYHLNGDIAAWDEIELDTIVENALKALEQEVADEET